MHCAADGYAGKPFVGIGVRMSEQPVRYQRKVKPPGSASGHGRVFCLIVISVPVLLVLYIAMFFGFGYLYVANVQHLPVGQSEWDVVVDAQDIAKWLPDLEVSTSGEELKKIRHLDRSYEVNYEYDPTDASVYITSSVSVERKLSDAIAGYLPLWTATRAGFMVSDNDDIDVEALEDYFEWGDQSKTGLIRNAGEPHGHLFVARQGKKVVFLLVSGVYFDDAAMWAEFITPTLNSLSRYDPE